MHADRTTRSTRRLSWLPYVALTALVAGLVLSGIEPSVEAAKDDHEPVTSVKLARSWEEAVVEAKMLALPIVVHSHGFYCGPCWGMHSSVMCNDKYIEFANENTVEVICLSRLDEAIEKQEAKAATYKAKENGVEVEYLVEFPGLTKEQMFALNRSKGATYNNTGGIPYTCVVNPYTLEQMLFWSGGQSSKTLIDEITPIVEQFRKEHQVTLRRKDLRKYEEIEAEALTEASEGDFAKALKTFEKATKKTAGWPEDLLNRVNATRESIVKSATEAVDSIEAIVESDAKEARKQLARVKSKLKGTGLEARAVEIEGRIKETLAAALAK